MKLKGINPIEQHVEKIVLAVVAVVFVGVLTVQFLVSPNDVEYEGTKVPPNQVLTRLGSKAEGILSAMNDPDPSLPAIETPDLTGMYADRLASSSFQAPRVADASLGTGFSLSFTEVENVNGPVTPLRLPIPSGAMAVSQWTTVDPFFADANPGLDPYLPAAQPMDKVSVTVEAAVSGGLIEEALRAADEGRRAMPSHWWSEGGQGTIEVMSVSAERQRLNADGSWGESEPVESVRWSPGLLDAFNEGASEAETVSWDGLKARDLRELAGLAQADPSLVTQPSFIPSIAGVEWVRPTKVAERQARLEVEADIGRFEREIANLEDEIAQIEEQRTARSNQQQTTRTQPQQTGGLIRGGGGQPTRANRPNRPDAFQQRIEAKQQEIAERQESLDLLYEKLDEFAKAGIGQSAQPRRTAARRPAAGQPGAGRILGGGPRILGGGPRVLGGDPPSRSTRRRSPIGRTPGAESPGPLLDIESYPVWVHDFTAEPGATYRYRVRYGVNNPLFGRERSLGEENEALLSLASEPIVESDWSDWTDAVAVGRTSYFFVTNARDQGQLGQSASAATAEVFRMFYGYYRKHTITLEPGDAVQGEFRLPDDLPLFAVGEVEAADLEAYFAERDDGAGSVTRAPIPSVADDEDEEESRDWLTLVEPRYPLAVDAVMLDVAEYPLVEESGLAGGRAARILEVVFFDPISGVVARRPDRDQEMPEYLAVQQSAGLAESAEVRMPDLEALP